MKRVFTLFTIALCALVAMAQDNVQQVDSVNAELDSIMKRWEIELGEVVVKSTLPKTQLKGDALRTTVAGTILEKAGSTTDVLNKLPLLSAKRGEGVEVIGRGAAEVYINGRKVQDINELDRLRAEQVQSVDVIQNPGARYAASTKAVVRIQLKKIKGDGFSFIDSFDAAYRYRTTVTNNLDVNYRTGGLDITASMWAGTFGNKSLQENQLTYMDGNTRYGGSITQEQYFRWSGYSPQLQFNYMINDKHSLGAFYKWDHNFNDKNHGTLATDNYRNEVLEESSLSRIAVERKFRKHIISGYYNGSFGQLTVDFNVDALFNKNNEDNNTFEVITKYDDSVQQSHSVENTTNASNSFWATKLVLSHPLWQGNLSLGGEFSRNHRTDSYDYFSQETLPVKASDNVINENVGSAFMEYGRRVGRVFLQAGLRYEHLTNDYYNFGKREDDVCRNYGDFFPTMVLSMPVGKTQMSLSYRKDIIRPSYQQLSTSTIYINHYSYQRGNPYLKPNYVHNVVYNLAYSWMNFNARYARDIDRMSLVTEPFPGSDDPLISLVHEANAEHAFNSLDLSISARPTIGVWHPVLSAYVHFQDYKTLNIHGQLATCNRPYAQFYWNNDIELPWNLRLNAWLRLGTRGDYGNYRITRAMLTSEIGLQRDFNLKNDMGQITVDLRAFDPFNLSKESICLMGVRELVYTNPGRANYSINITWKFNEAQKKYKGTGAGNSQKNRM